MLCGIGVLVLRGVDEDTGYLTGVLPGMLVFSAGLVLLVAPLTSSVLAAAPDRFAGIASGINNAVARTGSLLSVSALPAAVGIDGEAYQQPAVFGAGYAQALLICAVLLFAGGLVGLVGLRSGRTCAEPRPTLAGVARVTLQTIADQVGVSRMTVSNAFSRPDQLSASLRHRILDAATELGYVGPDPAARALARGTTGTVGVLLTSSLQYAFDDDVATGFLAAVAGGAGPDRARHHPAVLGHGRRRDPGPRRGDGRRAGLLLRAAPVRRRVARPTGPAGGLRRRGARPSRSAASTSTTAAAPGRPRSTSSTSGTATSRS